MEKDIEKKSLREIMGEAENPPEKIDPKKTFYQIGDLYYPQFAIDQALNRVMEANFKFILSKNPTNPARAMRKIAAFQTSYARKEVWKKVVALVKKTHIGISLKKLGPGCTIIKAQKAMAELA